MRRRVHHSQTAFFFGAPEPRLIPRVVRVKVVRRLHAMGEALTVSEWSKRSGLSRSLIRARKRNGWTDEEAVTVPDNTRHAGLRLPAGHPESVSWTRDAWEDDDHAWYVVAHHPEGLTLEQIGAVMGLSDERVRQIVEEALEKLRQLAEIRAEMLARKGECESMELSDLLRGGLVSELFFRTEQEHVA